MKRGNSWSFWKSVRHRRIERATHFGGVAQALYIAAHPFYTMASTMTVAALVVYTVVVILCQDSATAFEETYAASMLPESRTLPHQRRLLTVDCPSKCDFRCSKAGEKKRCGSYCLLCCRKCQCVPPGFTGNKEACPCYANLKNSKGGDKCP